MLSENPNLCGRKRECRSEGESENERTKVGLVFKLRVQGNVRVSMKALECAGVMGTGTVQERVKVRAYGRAKVRV